MEQLLNRQRIVRLRERVALKIAPWLLKRESWWPPQGWVAYHGTSVNPHTTKVMFK